MAVTERLLTVSDLCRLLHVREPTLYAWRCDGKGPPCLRVGKGI
jgi:hypothetical protein